MIIRYPSAVRSGFTLIELSIALAVIALLIGSVLLGTSMLRSAQLQAVLSEVVKYRQAVSAFRDKYNELPGDFSRATAFWGAVSSTPATCWATAGTGTQTCDGNGDGRIGLQCAACETVSAQYEQFRAWQHLANAGMIDGQYTGVNGPIGPHDAQPGINVPASKLTGAGYNLTSLTYNEYLTTSAFNYYYPLPLQSFLQFGSRATSLNGDTVNPVLTTQEALSLDSKQDDGLPGSGIIMAFKQGNNVVPKCTTSTNPATAQYDVNQNGYQCNLLFMLGL